MNLYEIILEDTSKKEINTEKHFVSAECIDAVYKEFKEFAYQYEYEIVSITRLVPISRNISHQREKTIHDK